jgi:UDP-N-acetylglucosamine 2-epimerase (non-hydrolysing)
MNAAIYIFIGTTAELIKLFPVLIELKKREVNFEIIASGQNNIVDSELLSGFEIPKPSIVLSNSQHKQSTVGLLVWFFSTLFYGWRVLKKAMCRGGGSVMVVHGDTVSTVMGAILGRVLGMKVAHVEAGLRSYDYFNPFPEEIDRVITSSLANFHYAPNSWSANNLKNKTGDIVNTDENTLLDSLRIAQNTAGMPSVLDDLSGKTYFVFVLHRQENLFDTDFVTFMIRRCVQQAKEQHCVLVLHELTKIKLEEMGLLSALRKNPNFSLVPRLPYLDFMKVLGTCEYLVTDGGSNQEESYYLGKPCLILRTHTERIEGLNENVLLSEKNESVINSFFEDIDFYKKDPKIYDCHPSAIIAEHLEYVLIESRVS